MQKKKSKGLFLREFLKRNSHIFTKYFVPAKISYLNSLQAEIHWGP